MKKVLTVLLVGLCSGFFMSYSCVLASGDGKDNEKKGAKGVAGKALGVYLDDKKRQSNRKKDNKSKRNEAMVDGIEKVVGGKK